MAKKEKNPAAVELGRLGGKAPKTRPFGFGAMTPEQRSKASLAGVKARARARSKTRPKNS